MRWTLVTGGARGLGASICRTLASQRRALLIHYRSSKSAADLLVGECIELGAPAAAAVFGEFSSEKGVEAFAAQITSEFFEIDGLVNNVGSYLVKATSTTSLQEWHGLFQSNLFAPMLLIQRLLPAMRQRHGGAVVNIGVAGLDLVEASVQRAAYRAAKGALLLATRSLARELIAENISLNMVSPGYLIDSIDFPKSPTIGGGEGGRPAAFEEVARLVTFLLSPENRYITGQNIDVAGGAFL